MSSKSDSSVVGRMKHLLSTGVGADCRFLVGKDGTEKELMSAHQSILLSASDVFEAMFRFEAENLKITTPQGKAVIGPVEIVDVEPVAFKKMLSFIYADDLSEMNGENAMAVLYAAKKYVVTPLVKACLAFPIPKLHNVFLAFAQARILGEEDFARRCLEHIDQNASSLIHTESFLQIDQNLLSELLERDQLKIGGGEIEIWNAALRWADKQCQQNDMECSAGNRRAFLGSALYKIRFRLIQQMEFTTKIVPSSVLNSDEMLSVYISYHTHPNAPSLYPHRFSTEYRARLVSTNANLKLKIEQFSEFSRKGAFRQSQSPLHMAGFEWRILAFSQPKDLIGEKYFFHFHVQCDNPDAYDCDDAEWSINCSVTMQILSQKNGVDNYCKTLNNVFSESDPNLQYNRFINVEHLMNARNGLCCNDTVTLCVDLIVDEEPNGGLKY